MLILSIGGQGDGKSMINAEITFKAATGHYDPVLKRKNPRQMNVHSNCALYFCHPPIRTIDPIDGRVTVTASCKCKSAQPNGDLNPLSLIKQVRQNPNYLKGTALFFTEFHRWADSQLSMQLTKQFKVSELLFAYLIDESRKRYFTLIMDSQTRMKIYNRIRDAVTYIILCNNYSIDKESTKPALEYIVIRDLGSPRGPKWWRFRPSPSWVNFYGGLFNSWETPTRITQAELAFGSPIEIADDLDSVIAQSNDLDRGIRFNEEGEGLTQEIKANLNE